MTSLRKTEAVYRMDAIAIGEGMPTYTTLRETLRVVQENANNLTQQIYGMAICAGVKPEIAQPALDAWNIDHAAVMKRVQDATP